MQKFRTMVQEIIERKGAEQALRKAKNVSGIWPTQRQ